jgi:hypothetical protein
VIPTKPFGFEPALFESQDGRLPRGHYCPDCGYTCVGDLGEEAELLRLYIKHLVDGCGD